MNLSAFSIRRPLTTVMVVAALLIFGFISLPKMAVELYPELNVPVAVVVTSVDGGTPTEVEELVTKPIESAVGTVANVSEVMSTSAEGASQVVILFNWGTDLDQATLDLRDNVDLVEGQLPDSANAPRILRIDPNSEPIMNFVLTGDRSATELKALAEDVVQPQLERIEGVASVSISGGQDRVIEIVADPNKMIAYGLTLDQIRQALAVTNLSGSAGVVQDGDTRLSIRVEGEFRDVEAIGETPISVPGGVIPLKHIAAVQDTLTEVTSISTYNGTPSVGLGILKASGGNTLQIAQEVRDSLADIQAELGDRAQLLLTLDASEYIEDSVMTVTEHALLGGLFAVLILFLFLNSVRSVLIVSVVIPISLVTTFTLMYFTGQTINLISMAGLTLGLGSLVDFAVVILENIYRLRQQGKGMLEAAKEGSAQVGTAVMASALAQIAVFAPIVFVEGLASELFGPLALAVVYSHVAALVVSIMLVPMLSAKWLKRLPDESIYHSGTYKGYNPIIWFNIGFEKVSSGYGRLLAWSLKHRKAILALTLALFVGAAALLPLVGMEFIPAFDQGQISVSIKMPTGTLLSETEAVAAKVEELAKQIPEKESIAVSVGSSGGFALFASRTSNLASVNVTLVPLEERTRSTDEVVEELRKQTASIAGPEITVAQADVSGGPPAGAPLSISLKGEDLEVLKDIGDVIAAEVRRIEGTRNVATSLDDTQREFRVNVDAEKAGLYGLTTSQVLSAVRVGFEGETVSRFRTGDDEIDVRLRMPESFRQDLGYLERFRITSPTGATVALSSIATIEETDVPQSIGRNNQTREVTITSDLSGRSLGAVSNDVGAMLAGLSLPEGYTADIGGQSEDMAESFGSLGLAIILSIVLVYMVMVSQFENLFTPFVIMFSIPPTLIGVVIGLVVTNVSLSVPALIGYILLIGIVVNNAIVLLDYVNQLRAGGMERDEAMLKAGPTRLRPILMTTLTTVLAILPLAFGGGEGSESQAPMAITVAFGLTFSTLITLVLIPVVYTWFDDLGLKFRARRMKRKQTTAGEAV